MRDDGSEAAQGEVGEILVRGPNVTIGYWNNPEATSVALADGWYHTGDVGVLQEGDYLFVVDRVKDMIVSGGENVYSIEVEDVLCRHPAVLEAAVFGIPDDRWGEAVHAVVVVAVEAGRESRAPRDGDEGPLSERHRRIQGAQEDRDPARAAAEVGPGQDLEAEPARSVLGRIGHEESTDAIGEEDPTMTSRILVADVNVETCHWIGGEPTPVGSRTFTVFSPIDGTVLGEVSAGGAADVDRAVQAARSAFPAWVALGPLGRSRNPRSIRARNRGADGATVGCGDGRQRLASPR